MAQARIEAYLLRLDPGSFYLRKLSRAGHARPLVGLVDALVRSPAARGLPGVVAVLRKNPSPLLVFAGPLNASGRARLNYLDGLVGEAGERIRILGWPDVERASTQLAREVEGVLGPAAGHSRIIPVPRGGLIVASLLGYALGSPASRFGFPGSLFDGSKLPSVASSEDPLLVVDDVVLSGVRLREVLRALPCHRRVVIATLASHPQLRQVVCSSEPQVDAFVSALDLEDHAPRLLGDSADSWRRLWSDRVPERYHTALLDLIVFPWSEPPLRLWNDVEGTMEEGWRVAPPEFCFRSRAVDPAIPLQIADDLPGIHRLGLQVIPVELGDRTLVVNASSAGTARSNLPSVTLRGTAREIWHLWMPEGRQAAVDGMQARYPDVDPDRICRDVDALLAQLSDAGIARLDP